MVTSISINNQDNLKITPVESKVINAFVQYCKETLPIQGEISILLLNKKNEYQVTTGAFNRHSGEIYSRIEGRAVVDVLRTIAHELVHQQQKELGKYNDDTVIPDIGGEIEDEANAQAGILIKKFVKDNDCRFIYEL